MRNVIKSELLHFYSFGTVAFMLMHKRRIYLINKLCFFQKEQKTLTLFFLNSSIELSVKYNLLNLGFNSKFKIKHSKLNLTLNFAGGYREVEIPSPIPNLEVKHFIADNTAGSPGGNVGRCQLLSLLIKAFTYSYFKKYFQVEAFFFVCFLGFIFFISFSEH